jgi:hypothetical protein
MALAARIPRWAHWRTLRAMCTTPLGAVMKPRTLVGAAVVAPGAARLAAIGRPAGWTSSVNPPDG